jgi:hypothetical protein
MAPDGRATVTVVQDLGRRPIGDQVGFATAMGHRPLQCLAFKPLQLIADTL